IPGYSEEEKLVIAQEHLLPRQVAEHGLKADQLEVPPQTLKTLIRSYTREAGVRELTRELAAVCRKVALQVAEGRIEHARVLPEELEKLLGLPRFDTEAADLEETVGAATGLAWTPWGGEVLRVEVNAMRTTRPKGLILTGQ